jgi:UPF0716 family protein affecting phage T7 exclusion
MSSDTRRLLLGFVLMFAIEIAFVIWVVSSWP